MSHTQSETARVYLVGGGIAALAAAAFLIREADVQGHRITVLEELPLIGGALDAAGDAAQGYTLRGGRMIEAKYQCTFDLFAAIPTLDGTKTVAQEIHDWNETMQTSSKARLVRRGLRETAPEFGLSEGQILTIERLAISPEALLGASTIADQFDPAFFTSNFWFMWCSTFAFQPWHSAVEFKRYLVRFAHLVAGFNRLQGIQRTVLNQYDSLVRPLRRWLDARGVEFALATKVTELELDEGPGRTRVAALAVTRAGVPGRIVLERGDRVLVTLGSMVEGSVAGGMDQAPNAARPATGAGSWALWEKLAHGRPQFGRPQVFAGQPAKSTWVSFTTTLRDPTLLRLVRDLTGNVPGEGGLITFPQSGWLASIVIPHQPHFIDQPVDVSVLWGYGLAMDTPGDFVKKPMPDCTGREVMTEILGHLGITGQAVVILDNCICLPCRMPYITSQFMPRRPGDRPQVVPEGCENLGLIGQFVELPDDVVFTVEYSIRSAHAAVAALWGLKRGPPPVYQGKFDLRVLYKAFRALHDLPV